MHGARTHLLPFLVSFTLLPRILGAEVNVTIDDQYGDPTTGQVIQYNPPQAWQVGQTCSSCTAQPSPASNAHNGTWMDASFFPTGTGTNGVSGQLIQASVPFIGTAVYVQVILTGSLTSPDGNTDFTFYIDNVTEGVFQQSPNGDTSYKFNQTVFSKTDLSNSLHTVTIEAGRAGQKALVLLDSIIYTKQTASTATSSSASPSSSSAADSSESKSSSLNIGVIVGPVVGGVIVAGAILALLYFLRHRRQGQRVRVLIDSPAMDSITPVRPGTGARPGLIDEQLESATHIDPFIETSPRTPYSPYNSGVYTGSARGMETATGSRSELGYGPSQRNDPSMGSSSQHLVTQPLDNISRYGQVDELAIDAHTPLASPPAYSEADSSGSSDVSRLPNPYGKTAPA